MADNATTMSPLEQLGGELNQFFLILMGMIVFCKSYFIIELHFLMFYKYS